MQIGNRKEFIWMTLSKGKYGKIELWAEQLKIGEQNYHDYNHYTVTITIVMSPRLENFNHDCSWVYFKEWKVAQHFHPTFSLITPKLYLCDKTIQWCIPFVSSYLVYYLISLLNMYLWSLNACLGKWPKIVICMLNLELNCVYLVCWLVLLLCSMMGRSLVPKIIQNL